MSSGGSAVPRIATLLLWLLLLLLLLLLLRGATPRVSRENGLSQRVQDHLQRIGCQHVHWPISCAEDCKQLLLLLLLLRSIASQRESK